MSILREYEADNAGFTMYFTTYECDNCSSEIEDAWPRCVVGDKDYCIKCAYILDIIDSKTYVDNIGGISSKMFKASKHPETKEIEVACKNNKFSWEVTDKDHRKTAKYKNWRDEVFKRDNFTCQKCGQVGGVLNAHHIKPFSKYKKLRYEVSNGITLCYKCHLVEHKRGD